MRIATALVTGFAATALVISPSVASGVQALAGSPAAMKAVRGLTDVQAVAETAATGVAS